MASLVVCSHASQVLYRTLRAWPAFSHACHALCRARPSSPQARRSASAFHEACNSGPALGASAESPSTCRPSESGCCWPVPGTSEVLWRILIERDVLSVCEPLASEVPSVGRVPPSGFMLLSGDGQQPSPLQAKPGSRRDLEEQFESKESSVISL